MNGVGAETRNKSNELVLLLTAKAAPLTLDSDSGSVRDGSSETGSTGVDSSLRW